MLRRKHFLFMLCIGLAAVSTSPHTSAQYSEHAPRQSERSAPDTAWARLTAPPSFAYRNKREGAQPPVKEKPYKTPLLLRIIGAIISFFSTGVGVVLLWSVLLGVVVYVVWRVFMKEGRFVRGAKKLNADEADPDEADLEGTAWMRLMEEAVAAGNLRAAVRYGYLHLLQALNERSLIQYRPGKTNNDYAAELAGVGGAQDFRALSRSYEYTWYGSYPITAPQFDAYRARIIALQNGVRA